MNPTHIGCDKPEQAAKLIRENFSVAGSIEIGTDFIEVELDSSRIPEINQALILSGINITEIKSLGISYEDYFLKKMGTYNVGKGIGKYA